MIKAIFHKVLLQKVTIAKWQLDFFGFICIVIGLVLGGYIAATHVIPLIFAATSPWTQTDWSGGVSASVATGTVTTYSSVSSTDPTTSAGNLTLSLTSNWYNSSWKYRRKITFDNTTATLGTTSEALTNFPVLVKLMESPR